MAGRFSLPLPERRHGGRPWFRIGQIDVTTTVLVTLLCIVSMFVWAIDRTALEPLWLVPERVFELQLWRLVTWPIPTEPTLWTVIMLAIFWLFGREIEGLLGRDRFAWFLVILTLVPAVVATLVDLPQAGLRPIQFSVFLVFIAQYPTARFLFNIPAWALGAVFLGLEFLQLLGMRDTRGMVFTIVTLATAAILARSYGLIPVLARYVPALPVPGGDSADRTKRQRTPKAPKAPKRPARPARPGRTVVEGPWNAAPAGPPADTRAMQAELDDLLDKIHARGMDSLTTDEKRRLNDLSKRLR
ncbi:MAG: DUF6576 domain-containing protein [Ilumatobacteraceae bacterium]